MSARPEYTGPQHAPWLTIAILVAIYVLMVIAMWWGRHRRDDHERQHQISNAQYMREIRRHGRGEWDAE